MGRWVLAGTSKPYGKEETDMDTGRERQKKNMTEEDYRTKIKIRIEIRVGRKKLWQKFCLFIIRACLVHEY
jgi:hypothetical protein